MNSPPNLVWTIYTVLAADFDVNVNFLDEKAFHVSNVRLWYFPTYLDPSEEEHSLNVNE